MKEIKLFDYQEDMVRRIGDAFEEHLSIMVQMPTGTGKTHLLAAIVREVVQQPAKPCVWIIAHRRELVSQINDTLERFGISSAESHVMVMSIQWLSRHYDEMTKAPGLIVIDEAHHALAETYQEMWKRYPKAKFLGLTATPCRLNRKGFTDLFETLVSSYTIGKFIQSGYLAPFDYVSIRPDSVEQKLVDSLVKRGADGDFQTKEMNKVLNTRPSIERLYQSMAKYGKDMKGIVYAINVEHARNIVDYYLSKGVAAVEIDCKTPVTQRKLMIQDFKLGKIRVLVNVDIFSEGFDCPDVEFVQLARPTLSLAKYLQMVGRGLRMAKGKEACTFIDNVGLYRMFGLPTMPWDWQGLFRGRFYHKRLTDYRQMLLKGNEWYRLQPLSDYERGNDPKIMVLMKHDRLIQQEQVESKKACTDANDYKIVKRQYGYGIISVFDGIEKFGVLCLEDKRVILPPVCWRDIQIFPNRTAIARRINDINDLFVDLVSGRSFVFLLFSELSAQIYSFGNMSVLRVRNEFYTRTLKSYVTVFPISKSDISFHGFYLLIHDPMARREMPVCVIDGDEKQYYWLVDALADGSILVMTEENVYFHVMQDGTKKKVNASEVKALKENGKKQKEKGQSAEPRVVEPVKMGTKWGLKADGKLIVAPIYRNIKSLNEDYFAIEKLPTMWGIINLSGKVVVKPQYPKIELRGKSLAVLYKVNGQQELKKLD